MIDVIDLFFTVISNFITVLGQVQILGLPFIYFVVGFMLMAIAIKYIIK